MAFQNKLRENKGDGSGNILWPCKNVIISSVQWIFSLPKLNIKIWLYNNQLTSYKHTCTYSHKSMQSLEVLYLTGKSWGIAIDLLEWLFHGKSSGCTGIIARAEKRCESNSGIKSVPHNFCPLNSGVCLVVAYLEAKTAFSMLLKTTLVYSPVSLSYLHELPRNTRVVGGQCWAQQSAHTGQAILLGISWFCQKLISST